MSLALAIDTNGRSLALLAQSSLLTMDAEMFVLLSFIGTRAERCGHAVLIDFPFLPFRRHTLRPAAARNIKTPSQPQTSKTCSFIAAVALLTTTDREQHLRPYHKGTAVQTQPAVMYGSMASAVGVGQTVTVTVIDGIQF